LARIHQTENAAAAHEEAFISDAFYFSSERKRKLLEEERISYLPVIPDFVALLEKSLGMV